MIVNSLDSGWEIIYQRSHAILAAELVSPWREDQRPRRWTETLVAIAQHDDQENFWESRHLSKIGAPLDFTQEDLDTHKIQARTVIESARQQSLWIALMISRHNSFLYETMRGQDAEMDAFLDEQVENRKAWAKHLGIKKQDIERAYAIVGYGDRLSLILCKRELPDRERALEISAGPDGERFEVMQRLDGTVNVQPWPHQVDRVRFSVEVRRLTQFAFQNESEFRAALQSAPIETREWEFVR